MESGFHYCIDRFVVFMQTVHLAGWAFSEKAPIRRIRFVTRNGRELEFSTHGLASDDVVEIFGESSRKSRFDEHWLCDAQSADVTSGKLIFELEDGSREEITRLGVEAVGRDPTHALTRRFFDHLKEMKPGSLLEIGSRARSGTVRRDGVPPSWNYVGLDVLPGENVDVVGDAHSLSKMFPRNSFRAVMAFSVLEHILMPWRFALELNRVMELSAIGLLATHQCWPLHDEPWDFWRFSDHSWKALFNSATGFKILEIRSGEPAFVVANHCHAITDFPSIPGGFLSSVVLFQKEAETDLKWDVEASAILETTYPSGTTSVRR